jgi:hypothetical protein
MFSDTTFPRLKLWLVVPTIFLTLFHHFFALLLRRPLDFLISETIKLRKVL